MPRHAVQLFLYLENDNLPKKIQERFNESVNYIIKEEKINTLNLCYVEKKIARKFVIKYICSSHFIKKLLK